MWRKIRSGVCACEWVQFPVFFHVNKAAVKHEEKSLEHTVTLLGTSVKPPVGANIQLVNHMAAIYKKEGPTLY